MALSTRRHAHVTGHLGVSIIIRPGGKPPKNPRYPRYAGRYINKQSKFPNIFLFTAGSNPSLHPNIFSIKPVNTTVLLHIRCEFTNSRIECIQLHVQKTILWQILLSMPNKDCDDTAFQGGGFGSDDSYMQE